MWTEEHQRTKRYLNFVLRHGSEYFDVGISSDGFAPLNAILDHKHTKEHYSSLNLEVIQTINKMSGNKRYELKEVNGQIFIRSFHGHSIKDLLEYEEIFKRKITDADEFPLVVYRTYEGCWEKIEIEGIKPRDERHHIHFRPYYPNSTRGFDVTVEIDLKMAIADGMKFYECFNGVIATPGIDGVVAPKYFKDIKKAFMQEVTDEHPTVVYAASNKNWEKINYKGINPEKSRTYIHLSIGYPSEGQIVPFMIIPNEIYIEIDMKQAMSDGMKFFITENENVLATSGLDGVIDKKYFKAIKNKDELNEITDATKYPTVVFGTSAKEWKLMQYKGIRNDCKQRQHMKCIHLLNGYPKEGQKNSEVYIEIDLKQAMTDGMKFYQTDEENVITTTGIDGIINKKYFKKVGNKTEEQTRGLREVLAKLLL